MVDRLISDYNKSPKNKEFEFRFITSAAEFKKLYGLFCQNHKHQGVEFSVNTITSEEASYIRKSIFTKTDKQTIFLRKKRLGTVYMKDILDYSISLSSETELNTTILKITDDTICRFKTRSSFLIDQVWRFDFTAVRTSKLNLLRKTEIAEIIAKTFKWDLSYEKIMEDESLFTSFEIEIEYVGRALLTSDCLKITNWIFGADPSYQKDIEYKEELLLCAKKIGKHNVRGFKLKNVANQVKVLTKNEYYESIFPPVDYFVTEKTDGLRAFVHVVGDSCKVITDSQLLEFKAAAPAKLDIIADGELCYKKDEPYLVLFDVMVVDGAVLQGPYTERIVLLPDIAAQITNWVPCQTKNIIQIVDPQDIMRVYNKQGEGLILIQPDKNYHQTVSYKWKERKHITIDCLAMECPTELVGIAPFVKQAKRLFILFVGIAYESFQKTGLRKLKYYNLLFPAAKQKYFPIHMDISAIPDAYVFHSDDPLHGKIIELGRNAENTEWELVKIRTDRTPSDVYFGNDFNIAELTAINYIDPFTVEDLCTKTAGYFNKANDRYVAATRFNRFVISLALKDLFTAKANIIDLACGRGGDLHRYFKLQIKNLLCVDIDTQAIAELIKRKYSIQKSTTNEIVKTTTHTLVADLKTPDVDLIAKMLQYNFQPETVDGIVCNFALHYLCDNLQNLQNILSFCSKMLVKGGVFCITVMDGEVLFNKLKDHKQGESWVLTEEDTIKYKVTKEYTASKITASGQFISIKLPFSEKMYLEPLCNIKAVIKEAKMFHFTPVLNQSFSYYMEDYKKFAPDLAKKITPADSEHIDLYKIICLRKN